MLLTHEAFPIGLKLGARNVKPSPQRYTTRKNSIALRQLTQLQTLRSSLYAWPGF